MILRDLNRRIVLEAAAVLGVAGALAVVGVVAFAPEAPSSSGPPTQSLRFLEAPKWRTEATGMRPISPQAPSVMAANVRLLDPPGGIPTDTLRHLGARGIVLVATISAPMHPNEQAVFQPRSLPLDLGSAAVQSSWETQPNPNVPQYVLSQRTNGYDLDVRVFFATQHPSRQLLAAAQTELKRLAVPRLSR